VALVNFLFPFDGKIILQDHGLFNKKKNFHLLLSQIFKPKYYIGVSRSLTEWAIQDLGISFKNVFLLENSIVKKDNKAEISKHFDFILVSNIKRNKNNAFAIELAESMNKPLLLVGKIQDEDYYNSIKSKLNNAINLDSTISNAQSVMHCADFALHTSLSETGPIVLLEYIAQHKPFLAFETGEIAVILKKYFPLFFIDNFDVKKWQERIEKIKEFPLDYTKFDEVLEKEFGQEKYYQKLVSIYSCVQKNN
jgi:glycosyltransferase involved in cell wall biosynthesis